MTSEEDVSVIQKPTIFALIFLSAADLARALLKGVSCKGSSFVVIFCRRS